MVGTGAIGARVIELAKAFRMNVLAYNRTPGKVKDVDYVALEELLELSLIHI